MIAKPIRALELHYPMIQFLINRLSQGQKQSSRWCTYILLKQRSAYQMLFVFTLFTLQNIVKKSNLLPIQAREGLGVISGCIFCLQVREPIAGGLISGGGVGGAFNGGSLRYKNNRETNTHFFNKHILYW